MASRAMFEQLIFDENGHPVDVAFIGANVHYVINDDGFKRHIDAEVIDRQVLAVFLEQLDGNHDLAVEQTLKMIGKDDIFTKAALDAELKNVDVEDILKQGVPPQARDMLGMLGFRVVIDYRGELVRIDQPNVPESWNPDGLGE